jgi:hypothetical protein
LNLRPSGYEPDELPDCSTPRWVGGIVEGVRVSEVGGQKPVPDLDPGPDGAWRACGGATASSDFLSSGVWDPSLEDLAATYSPAP